MSPVRPVNCDLFSENGSGQKETFPDHIIYFREISLAHDKRVAAKGGVSFDDSRVDIQELAAKPDNVAPIRSRHCAA